jgi:lysophospholipase L1-like esterase
LIALELVVRYISPSIFHPDIALIPNQDIKMNINLTGVSPVVHYSTNKWGFRGDEIPSDIDEYYFILAIGGSTTECFVLDDKKTWPYLLQQFLKNSSNEKIIVQNGGLAGHTTRGHLLMMKHVVPKVKPDALIFLVGVNDLTLSLTGGPYLYENTSKDYKLFVNYRSYQILSSWKKALTGEVIWGKAPYKDIEFKKLTKPEPEFSSDYQDELTSLPEFEKNIKEIIKIGRQYNIRMIFFTQPTLFEDTGYWSNVESRTAWAKSKYYISAKTYARMLDKFNKKLLKICDEEQVECSDLASRIPRSREYFYDDVHFTEKGSLLMAEEIYKYISTN